MSDIVDRLRRWNHCSSVHACAIMADAAAEIESLRLAIRRLADQDATLSVQGGSVTVTIDATITDAEREAIENAADVIDAKTCGNAATLRGLLKRLGRERCDLRLVRCIAWFCERREVQRCRCHTKATASICERAGA